MRKAFLGPYHPMVEDIWLYALADAQARTGVALHSGVLVVNHHHLSVTPSADNISEFLRRIHRDMSVALHCLLCELRYDAPRELFDDRSPHRMRLLDAEAQAAHYIYEQLNGVAAGLVSRPEHMPQRPIGARLWRAGGRTVERPPLYFHHRERPATRELLVTPPPELYCAFDGDLDALVHQLERTTEHARRHLVAARGGRPPVGAQGLRRIHPWSEPRTLREAGGQPVPTYKVGARGLARVQLEVAAAGDTKRFRAEHRAARVAGRDGQLGAVYPYGTNKAVIIDRAPMQAEPHLDAIVTRPGRTFEEVREALAHERRAGQGASEPGPSDDRVAARRAIMDEIRSAFEDEAAEVVELESIEIAKKAEPAGSEPARRGGRGGALQSGEQEPTRGGVEVRHRFDPRSQQSSTAARVVVLRDRRRGRPRKGEGHHGGDPPA